MDQTTMSQYEHRVGCVLVGGAFCDGCNHKFEDGEMAFRCLECSDFACPGGIRRPVRQTEITTATPIQDGPAIQSRTSETTFYTGYDLYLDCAKKPFYSFTPSFYIGSLSETECNSRTEVNPIRSSIVVDISHGLSCLASKCRYSKV